MAIAVAMKGAFVRTVAEGKLDRQVVLELPPSPEFVGTSRMVVSAMARHFGFDDEQVEDLKISVSEAVTNAIRAHQDAGSSDPVRIETSVRDDAIVVEVIDRGAGFDPGSITSFGATPLPGTLEGGLGLSLIRTLITDTTIRREVGGGMRLRMALKREAQPHGL